MRAAGLRCILLIQLRPNAPATEHHFALVADHFVNDTTILAYDLFNEPLYFDRPERPKEEAHAVLRHWRALFDEHAPDHLYTLGLTGIRETFEFDPNMLGVDFISYHPYEYEPDQVRNELRWYGDNVDVPWIIGETAIPADNDSVPYTEQEEFARRTLLQSRACGAIGYSWWQFQDVKWGRFHADFMGVLSRDGVSVTGSGDRVIGTAKPVVRAIKEFDPWADPGKCLCLPNYLNYSDGRVSEVSGRLVDEAGQPINEGTVIAWNEVWNESYPDGKYVVSGSGDRTARVWEALTGKEVARMTHDNIVGSVAFSPDGKYVVSGSDDKTARVWDAMTGKEVTRKTHDGGVNSVAFSPDGKYVVSGSQDGTVRIWAWQSEDLIASACAPMTRNLTRAEWAQFIGDAMPYQAVCNNLPFESEVSLTPTVTP